MMKEAILIIERTATIEAIVGFFFPKIKFEYSDENLISFNSFSIDGRFISLDLVDGILFEYEIQEIEFINSKLKTPLTYFLKFSDFILLKEVIILLSEKFDLLIDNDRGGIFNSNELKNMDDESVFYGFRN